MITKRCYEGRKRVFERGGKDGYTQYEGTNIQKEDKTGGSKQRDEDKSWQARKHKV